MTTQFQRTTTQCQRRTTTQCQLNSTEGCSERGSNESSSSIPTACEARSAFIDVGILVLSAHGSLDHLRQLGRDAQRMQYRAFHSKPTSKDVLQSHSVTKKGKTWSVKFQQKWLDQFPWLSYSSVLAGGIYRYCILFPEQPRRGGSQGAKPGVLVLSAYQNPYTKAPGKACLPWEVCNASTCSRAGWFFQTGRQKSCQKG